MATKRHWMWVSLGGLAMVAACGGAAAVGEALEDAGEALEDAGDAMIDAGVRALADAGMGAGEALQDAGGTLQDAGSAMRDAGSARAQEPAGDGLPRPHWVLRDAGGKPVQADAWPQWSADAHPQRFTNEHGDCVIINAFGQRAIGLAYSLASGKLDGCESTPPAATWRAASAAYLVAFTNPACDGVGYSLLGSRVLTVGGTPYYADGAPAAQAAYIWNGSACVAASPATRDLWELKPIPQDVLGLLPAAPYSLEIAY